jgi:arabinofuranosyltransferase
VTEAAAPARELGRTPGWWWWPAVPLAILLALHARVFWFVNDDAYISFVYARNFAEHNQLVFNLGERVEGYTNFLWTLLLGLLMKLGAAPEVWAPLLGLGFGVGTLIVTALLMARLRGRYSAWDWLPAAFLTASSGFACWCTGGLETMLFTFTAMLAIERLWASSYRASAVAFAACAMTRPEGLLILGLVVVHRLASNLVAERRVLLRRGEWYFALAFLGLYVPYFVWRLWYYGDLLPNTAYVKAGGTPSAKYLADLHAQGLYYVWQWAWQSKAVLAAPLAVLATLRWPRFASLGWLILVVYLAYTWRVGGDFMGLHRFVMPLFPLTAVLAALGLMAVHGWLPERSRLQVTAGTALVIGALFVWSQVSLTRASLETRADSGIDRPGYLRLYAEDREKIGRFLAPLIRPDELSWVGGVGVQPYWGRMRAYDVFGLVSRQVAHEVPPTRPRPGHQKWAPPAMVLATDPTFIFYCYQMHERPERVPLCADAGFFEARGYERCMVRIPGLRERGEYYTFLKKKSREFPCL